MFVFRRSAPKGRSLHTRRWIARVGQVRRRSLIALTIEAGIVAKSHVVHTSPPSGQRRRGPPGLSNRLLLSRVAPPPASISPRALEWRRCALVQ